jgi:NAD(P)-dependent dehydrogenase (short-subunit alcohol dehydrogenase family)
MPAEPKAAQTTLADRVVLITGCTGPLGRVATASFAAAGAKLGLVGTAKTRLAKLAADLHVDPDAWVGAKADLRRAGDATRAVAEITERFGRVDVVLHLVGGWSGGTKIPDIDRRDVDKMLDQHVWTTLHVARAVVPGMVERGWGRFIAISATVALDGASGMAAYAVAKAGEEALLRTLAKEVAGSGVTANVLVARKIDAAHQRERAPSPKNASWTTPEELVAAMRFLCSDEASAVNGVRIPFTGRG